MKTRRFFSLFFLLVLMASLVLTPASAADEESGVTPPELHCEAMLLVDANTGRMVYGKNEHEQMYPASLTKIMTALLVLEAVDSGQLSLDQQITAGISPVELSACHTTLRKLRGNLTKHLELQENQT